MAWSVSLSLQAGGVQNFLRAPSPGSLAFVGGAPTISIGGGGSPGFTYPSDSILRAAGYVLAIDFGADPTGNVDSTSAIQQAIDTAQSQGSVVWLHLGTYKISNTLRCYTWQTNISQTMIEHQITGASFNPNTNLPERPVIKLVANAAGFGNTGIVKPMIALRTFINLNPNSNPPFQPTGASIPTGAALLFNPLSTPSGWFDWVGETFYCLLQNVNFDTNQNVGAIGVHWPTTQVCELKNVKVTSTNSWASFSGLCGCGPSNINIEGDGGQYGVFLSTAPGAAVGGSNSGCTIVGLTLTGHTTCAIVPGDYVPMCIIGFNITPAGGAPVWRPVASDLGNGPEFSTTVFQDGTVTSTGGLAFDNTQDNGILLYLRNVYFTGGVTNLVRSGAASARTGSGTWSVINEYCCNTPNTANIEGSTPSVTLINGSFVGGLEPAVSITTNTSAPPSDLMSRHVPTIPNIDDGPYVDITGAGAASAAITQTTQLDVSNYCRLSASNPENRAAIQSAINTASAAGHGRVLVPRGIFFVNGAPVLQSNTKMFGIGQRSSIIAPHPNWVPNTGNPPVVDTVSDTEATVTFGNIQIGIPQNKGGISGGAFIGNRFNGLNWKVGRNSVCYNTIYEMEYTDSSFGSTQGNPHQLLSISGTGGGRFYSGTGGGADWLAGNAGFRQVLINGTSQPLWFYGLNVEFAKGGSFGTSPDMNIEITNASNVRIFDVKREGHSPTVVINGSDNIAIYGSGNLGVNSANAGVGAWGQVSANSTRILLAQWTYLENQQATVPTLKDLLTNVNVGNATQIALYKRGTIDDSLMAIGGSVPSPNGIFVTSPNLTSTSNNLPLSTYQTSYIDGTIIMALWSQIEPTPGVFDWSVVDNEINHAVANNKKLIINVTCGANAPSWLFSAPYNVANGTFLWGNHDCASGGTLYRVPVPWDSTYITRYGLMMQAFSSHLKSITGAYNLVVRVRLTGANTLTDEIHLAFCSTMTSGSLNGSPFTGNGNQLWQALGYTPNTMIAGLKSLYAKVSAAFPDRVLSQSILQSGDMPLINNAGAIIAGTSDPSYVDVTQSMITYALSAASGISSRFAVQWNGFQTAAGASAKVLAARAAGSIIGWCTNEHGGSSGGALCDNGSGGETVCTDGLGTSGFETLLNACISTGGQYIEIFQANVPTYPISIAAAQTALG